jgi:hypothetical protein
MTMKEGELMKIAAVADLHVRESDKGKWTDFFKEVSKKADVRNAPIGKPVNIEWII